MVSKKKQKKNEDFKKVKLKVGKKLKKTATTDSTIQSKKLVITTQLTEKEGTNEKPLSFRGLSLDELCKQLGHFNKNIRKEALTGTKQLLTSRPDLINEHLRTLIPSVARLLNESATDSTLTNLLKSLLNVICSVDEQSMSPHFTLLMAHVLRALTNMEIGTRILALSVLAVLIKNYPNLCKNNTDFFDSFVKFLASPRKPKWNSPKFLENILDFLSIYKNESNLQIKAVKCELNLDNYQLSEEINLTKIIYKGNGTFDFPLFAGGNSSSASPFEEPENIILLSQSLAPLVATALLEDSGGAFLNTTLSILEKIKNISSKHSNSFVIPDFNKKLREVWSQVKKAGLSRKNDRVRQSVAWICT